ncbi:hypothetical protein PRZ48_007819 [Zasmidium cellare]|uniref:Uncharacterized protein n=1 Tax=Zasmidium cellare TaxID=395010 RepID=A0ABR0ELB9_ZASCE|nr:hypothetical protein PRZ48_007819 [Zasmidium cellare]
MFWPGGSGGMTQWHQQAGTPANRSESTKLAASVINGHGTEDDVFDDRCLDLLDTFCADPSIATRDRMAAENGWGDGGTAAGKGDLVGYLVLRHGTDNPAFDERDLDMLKAWFEKGRPVGEKVSR